MLQFIIMEQGTGQKNNGLTVHISPSSVVWAAAVGLGLYALFLLSELVLVTITAVVIAAAISPIARWLVRHKLPRVIAVLVIYAGGAVVLLTVFYFLVLPLLAETAGFVDRLPGYLEDLENWTPFGEEGWMRDYPALEGFAEGFSAEELAKEFQEFTRGLGGGFLAATAAVFGGIMNFVLILVLSFYLAVQERGVPKFLEVVTPVRYQSYILDLWRRAEVKIGLWLQGQGVLAILVAVLVFLVLTLLGLPHALLLAVLAGLLELIPVFGPIMAAIPAIVVGFAMDGGGVTMALIVTAVYIIIQQIESQLIYPLVVRKVVGLSPILVILALVAGFQLGGFLGAILSVPLATILMEFIKDWQEYRKKQVTNEKLPLEEVSSNN